jgi:hypothetical protein
MISTVHESSLQRARLRSYTPELYEGPVKKCASCTKDLPDAALHCVFCGTKQPPAPAVQQGMAKTAFGYSANDVAEHLRQGSPPSRSMPSAPPPPPVSPAAAQPPRTPPPVQPAPYQPPRPPPASIGTAPTLAPNPPPAMPPGAAPRPSPPVAHPSYVPAAAAAAPTMFVQVAAPPSPPPRTPPSYGSPAAMQPTLVPPPLQQVMPPPVRAMQPQPPIMQIPAAQPPPYRASQTASRVGRPLEPWRASLRVLLFLWGVALLAAFATPLQTSPDLLFNWKLILEGAGLARLPPLMLAAIGLLSVIVAAIPMPASARGTIATVLGLAGIAAPIALIGAVPPWQASSLLGGLLVLVPGLVIRNEYRDSSMARLLVTLGVLAILAPSLIPQGGAIPLVSIFKALIDQPGIAKVNPALQLGLITVVVMSLLAWLPSPVTGGAKLWAWILILWSLITHVIHLVLQGNLGAVVTARPNEALTAWISGGGVGLGAAYLVLVGYGLATVVGKQLE